MLAILQIVLPLFGVIVCGAVVGRIGLINEAGVRGLSTYVFYVAIPLLLFRNVGRSDLPAIGDLGILFAYYGGAYAIFGIALLFGRVVFRLPIAELAIMGMAAMYSNIILLGVPLVHEVYGDAGLLPVTLIASIPTVLLVPPVIFLIEIGRGGRGNFRGLLWSAARSTATNPIIIGVIGGLVVAVGGLQLPGMVDRFVTLVASGAPSCALFALGTSLARQRIAGDPTQSAAIIVIKLFAMPALVWLFASQVFDLDPVWVTVATVTAALPTGANVFITARSFDTYVARATSATILSTALSVVTLTVLIVMLGVP